MKDNISMRIADPRSGHYRKNGHGQTSYESFVPTPLQEIQLWNIKELNNLADMAMSRLRGKDREGIDRSEEEVQSSIGLALGLPPLMLTPYDDSLQSRAKIDQGNLSKAMDYGLRALDSLPLSGRLIKDLHWIAMQGEHNGKAYPGEFRSSPVWMGTEYDTLSTAPFIPPSPDDMLKAFYDLEMYINADDAIHPLIKAALIHYQFEVIHPFIDGNGRIGRLLIMLFLAERGILHGCTVSISKALHLRAFQYFSGISSVEISGTYEKWVRFFLQILS